MVNDFNQNAERLVIVFLVYAEFLNNDDNINNLFLSQLNNLCKTLLTTPVNNTTTSLYAILSKANYKVKANNETVPVSSVFTYKIENNRISTVIRDDKNVVHKKVGLKKILKKIKKNEVLNYNTTNLKVFLNTWDHGNSFGVFQVRQPKIIPKTNWLDIPKDRPELRYLKVFLLNSAKSINKDCTISLDPEQNITNTYCLNNFAFSIKEKSFESDAEGIKDPEIVFIEKKFYLKSIHENAKQIEVEIKNESLTNSELSFAIKNSFGEIEILAMMNCCMMNFDSIYYFKSCVKYLIAPQTQIDFEAYDYESVFNFIYKSKKIDTLCIATNFIEAIRENKTHEKAANECAVFAIHLNSDFINAFQLRFDKMLNSIIKQLKDIKKIAYNLKYATSFCHSMDEKLNFHLKDLYHWLENVNFSSENASYDTDEITDLILFLNKNNELYKSFYICNPHIGSDWSFGNKGVVQSFDPTGLTIFLPHNTSNDLKSPIVKKFIKNSNPDSFYTINKQWYQLLKFITHS